MNGEAEIHPFDVMALSKGEWIPPDRCEPVIGMSRENKKYGLKLLGIKEQIEEQWKEYRDEVVTVICERDGLRICDDDKAVEENARRRKSHWRGVGRAQYRQMGVDASKISAPALKAKHERECVVGAAMILGAKKQAAAALRPHRRETPVLTGKK